MTTSTASIDRALTPQMRPPRTQTQIIWHKFRRHKAAVLSGIVLIVSDHRVFWRPLDRTL